MSIVTPDPGTRDRLARALATRAACDALLRALFAPLLAARASPVTRSRNYGPPPTCEPTEVEVRATATQTLDVFRPRLAARVPDALDPRRRGRWLDALVGGRLTTTHEGAEASPVPGAAARPFRRVAADALVVPVLAVGAASLFDHYDDALADLLRAVRRRERAPEIAAPALLRGAAPSARWLLVAQVDEDDVRAGEPAFDPPTVRLLALQGVAVAALREDGSLALEGDVAALAVEAWGGGGGEEESTRALPAPDAGASPPGDE